MSPSWQVYGEGLKIYLKMEYLWRYNLSSNHSHPSPLITTGGVFLFLLGLEQRGGCAHDFLGRTMFALVWKGRGMSWDLANTLSPILHSYYNHVQEPHRSYEQYKTNPVLSPPSRLLTEKGKFIIKSIKDSISLQDT